MVAHVFHLDPVALLDETDPVKVAVRVAAAVHVGDTMAAARAKK